jgi:predicted nucleotidyltransferase component of viral defense system
VPLKLHVPPSYPQKVQVVVCADAFAEKIRRVRRHTNRETANDRLRIELLVLRQDSVNV